MNARIFKLSVVLALVACFANDLLAQSTVIYDNTSTFKNTGTANGSATLIGSNTTTALIADDIKFTVPAGTQIDGFTFSVANFNGVVVSARPVVRFYTDNSNLPGRCWQALI